MPWLPEEIKNELKKRWSSDPRNISKKDMEKHLKKILKKYNILPKKIQIKTTKTAVMEINSLDKFHKNIEFSFDPIISSLYSLEELDTMLHFQVFTLISMKVRSSNIRVPESSPELMDYLTDFTVLYDAFSAYLRFRAYFEKNEVYYKIKKDEIVNFGMIFYTLKHNIHSVPNQLIPLSIVIKTLQDANYFTLFHKDILNEWSKKHNFDSILQIYSWISEDFQLIYDTNPSTEQIFTLTQLIGGLSLGIIPSILLLDNKIVFTNGSLELHSKIRTRDESLTYQTIIDRWDKRILETMSQSDVYQKTSDEKIDELKQYLKKFDPTFLINCINATAAIPDNEIFGTRFDILLKIVYTVPFEEYRGETLNQAQISELFQKLNSLTNWSAIENYAPTKTMDYPPLWILGNRYEILPGSQMRAYENWKDLIAEFFPLQKIFEEKLSYNPIKIILNLLELQTKFYRKLMEETEFPSIESMKIASIQLIEKWQDIQSEWIKDNQEEIFFKNNSKTIGFLLENNQILSIEEENPFFTFLVTIQKDSLCIIPQHGIHEFLKFRFSNDLNSFKHDYMTLIQDNLDMRLYENLVKIFGSSSIIRKFSIDNLHPINYAVFFDVDKLFLINIIDVSFIEHNLDDEIKKVLNNFENLEKNISKDKYFLSDGKRVGKFYEKKFQIIPIILIKSNKFTQAVLFPNSDYLKNRVSLFGFYLDFLLLLSDVKEGLPFFIFVKRYNELKRRTKAIHFNILDVYAYYVQNLHSFVRSGLPVVEMIFESDLWEKYYLEKLNKLPDFQPRFKPTERDDFWEVYPLDERLFDVRNTLNSAIARIFLTKDKQDCWIFGPTGNEKLKTEELRIMYLMAELIPYRILKSNAFEQFLDQINVPKNIKLCFTIISDDAIKRDKIIKFTPALEELKNNPPLITQGFNSKIPNTTLFPLIYSSEKLTELFDKNSVEAEKKIMQIILASITRKFSEINNNSNLIINNTINKLFENARGAFSFTTLKDPMYTSRSSDDNYSEVLDSEESETTRKIAMFLAKEQVEQKIYKNDDAKKLLDKILKYLGIEFDNIISSINKEELIYKSLTEQGHLIEARSILEQKTQNDLKQIQEYDPIKKYREASQKISKNSNAMRFITERTLQLNSKHHEYLNDEKWADIHAVAEYISTTTAIRNYIHYQIENFSVNVHSDYGFFIGEEEATEIQNHIQNYDLELLKESKGFVNFGNEDESQFLAMISPPFQKRFGITFENFMEIMLRCLAFPISEKTNTVIVDENKLIPFIQKESPQLSDNEIKQGLELLSLSHEELDGKEIFSTDMRNRKERLMAKPLVKLKNGNTKYGNTKYGINSWFLRVSHFQWRDYLDKGFLPFKDDVNDDLSRMLTKIQHKTSKKFEGYVLAIIQTKTAICDPSVKEDHKCMKELIGFPGEIDTLAIFKKNKKILLAEAKHTTLNISALDISKEIKKYIDEKTGYEIKLLKKKAFIEKNLKHILNCYGISDTEGWNVDCLFVSNTFQFAVPGLKIPLIHVDDLSSHLGIYLN